MSLEEPILRCPSNHAKAAGKWEKLGAAHLLLHGIWAFKVSATGERTDLVPGEKLEITPQVEAASEALVLARKTTAFPTARVTRILEGGEEIPRHDTRQKPVWGHQFGAGEGAAGGNVTPTIARERIQLILRYLDSIQEKKTADGLARAANCWRSGHCYARSNSCRRGVPFIEAGGGSDSRQSGGARFTRGPDAKATGLWRLGTSAHREVDHALRAPLLRARLFQCGTGSAHQVYRPAKI
jgi:hypothetical protein